MRGDEHIVTVRLTAGEVAAVLATEHDALITPEYWADDSIEQALATFRRAVVNHYVWQEPA